MQGKHLREDGKTVRLKSEKTIQERFIRPEWVEKKAISARQRNAREKKLVSLIRVIKPVMKTIIKINCLIYKFQKLKSKSNL